MYIFEKAPFPSCHASTLVEHEPGKLLAAWFGGKAEGAKDVQIWSSTFDGKKWGELSVIGSEAGQPCWNPVFFKTAKGTLYLWYKAGPSPQNWTGYVRTSADNGKTWTEPAMIPSTLMGPVRAKPIQLADGTILAGTSWESYKNWTPFVDRSTDDGKTWTRSNPFPMPGKFNQIQPTLFEAKDGRIVALLRSKDPRRICRSESKDGGATFTPTEETKLENPSAGIDVVKTKAGDVFLIYNPVATARTPISLARSTDDGQTWKKVADLETEPGEYSYPAIIESSAGNLEITYTWRRTHIKHASADPKRWREKG
jgi:predicted neuraminidase